MGEMMKPSNHRLAERRLIALVRDGQWEIDGDGRVWRVGMRHGLRAGGSEIIQVQRRRAEKLTNLGYLMVRAMLDGVRVVGLAHRLVWQHLHGDLQVGMVINHINGVKDDNRPSNLEVVTYSENTTHAHRVGLIDQRGQRNPAAKISDHDVTAIRLAYASDVVTMRQLAERYGVSTQHVSKLVRGQRRAAQRGPIVEHDLRVQASAEVRHA